MPTTPSLRAAAEAFLAKFDLILEDPAYVGVFVSAHNHGIPYRGPQIAVEREALRTALAAGAAEPVPMPYTMKMGEAAERYLYKVNQHAHPLPAQFRWEECYAAMVAAELQQRDWEKRGSNAAHVDPSAASMERPAASGSEQP
jgi:hypothetical protein